MTEAPANDLADWAEARTRIVAALAARFRDLDLAEEAFADACVAALRTWRETGPPAEPTAWLYRTAHNRALDALRRRKVRANVRPDAPEPAADPEMLALEADEPIPDERLRLIFICCHPAIAPETRAALTLKLVCGLSTERLARAFLMAEPAMLQRITRAKRKIRDAGVPFETPGRAAWAERLEAVLATLEIAYGQAYEDAAGRSEAAAYGREVLRLSGLLAELLPQEPEALALAAMVRLAEARRPARVDELGAMIPLSEQDASLWNPALLAEGEALLENASRSGGDGPYRVMAAIHACHAARRHGGGVDWGAILALYDRLLVFRPSTVVAVNRCVALAEVMGPEAALAALDELEEPRLQRWRPWHAARGAFLARAGRYGEAVQSYRRALDLDPAPAERLFLEGRMQALFQEP